MEYFKNRQWRIKSFVARSFILFNPVESSEEAFDVWLSVILLGDFLFFTAINVAREESFYVENR